MTAGTKEELKLEAERGRNEMDRGNDKATAAKFLLIIMTEGATVNDVEML